MAKNTNTTSQKKSTTLIKKLLPENKALAISLAISLAFSGFGLCATTAAADSQNTKKDMVLVQEKEAGQDEGEWETDAEQSYSSYGPGYGYYYRPFSYIGNSFGRATWSTPTSVKRVGGYNISRGHVGS
ncbi:MAG: hypothetical protein CVU90_10080 [Firmicutes bacterium HGW-Firmicutes-15]|nr:MAG: hypothetical protein CVU90_10080 [Firmicutes bacterium HGW-Firmicutes-15]